MGFGSYQVTYGLEFAVAMKKLWEEGNNPLQKWARNTYGVEFGELWEEGNK